MPREYNSRLSNSSPCMTRKLRGSTLRAAPNGRFKLWSWAALAAAIEVFLKARTRPEKPESQVRQQQGNAEDVERPWPSFPVIPKHATTLPRPKRLVPRTCHLSACGRYAIGSDGRGCALLTASLQAIRCHTTLLFGRTRAPDGRLVHDRAPSLDRRAASGIRPDRNPTLPNSLMLGRCPAWRPVRCDPSRTSRLQPSGQSPPHFWNMLPCVVSLLVPPT